MGRSPICCTNTSGCLKVKWLRSHTRGRRKTREGKGIGKAITRGALEWAKVKGYKVLPTCSFVKKFADDNKDEEFVKGVVMDLKGRRVVSNNVKM